MISDTLKLMVLKDDFTKLEEICTKASKSTRHYHVLLRGSLQSSVPLNVLQNLQLDPQTRAYLMWNTFLANMIARDSSDITSLFEQLSLENFKGLRPTSLRNLISNEDSAQKLLSKAIEVNDNDFTANAFLSLVLEGHDSSAMQLWEKCESHIDLKMRKGDINKNNWQTKLENFAKQHGIHLELE